MLLPYMDKNGELTGSINQNLHKSTNKFKLTEESGKNYVVKTAE
tara:strand:- start:134 stop:265 length:132 start_codon:yes stop_codon:yes gene_type:complete